MAERANERTSSEKVQSSDTGTINLNRARKEELTRDYEYKFRVVGVGPNGNKGPGLKFDYYEKFIFMNENENDSYYHKPLEEIATDIYFSNHHVTEITVFRRRVPHWGVYAMSVHDYPTTTPNWYFNKDDSDD